MYYPAILNSNEQKSNAFQVYRGGLIFVRRNNPMKNFTRAIHNSKREYYRNTSQKLRINMHKTRSTIKSVLQTYQNKNIIKTILFINVEVTDDFDIAQLINEFFTQVTTELESIIPASNIDLSNLLSRVNASLFLYLVTVNECTKVVDKLKLTKTTFKQLPVKL